MVQKPKNKILYEKARMLRQRGLSYGNIAKECLTSKSNISLWCKDIILTKSQKDFLYKNKENAINIGAKRLHDIRLEEIDKIKSLARKEIEQNELDNFTFLVAGAMLYWAEGCKTTGLYLANSDERIIMLMVKWFKKFLNIEPKQIKAYLHLHENDDDSKIKSYWSDLTGIPLQNFGKSFIKPKGTGHRKNILPHGIIRIQICGKGIENTRHRIMTWVEQIYKIV